MLKVLGFKGRIHTAFVGNINYNTGTAAVEWVEHGESKGKDINLLLIKGLNPDIRIVRPSSMVEQSQLNRTEQPMVTEVSFVSPFFVVQCQTRYEKLFFNPSSHYLQHHTICSGHNQHVIEYLLLLLVTFFFL